MSRSDTERDIIETLGQVPVFFKEMPDATLEREWAQFKEFQMQDSAISAREKQLIGFAVAAAIHCPYCTYFHQSATEMMGTNREQLEEAARMAADTAKYSTSARPAVRRGLQEAVRRDASRPDQPPEAEHAA